MVEAAQTVLVLSSSQCCLHLLQVGWVSEPGFREQSFVCLGHILQVWAHVLLASQVSVTVVLLSVQPGEALR